MTVIRPNSISGITSITTLQNSIEFFKSDGSAGSNINNISINSPSGIITAAHFYGNGSNLTGITGTTINNNANNRIITGSGTANTLNAESELTYDGASILELQPGAATPARFIGDANRTGQGQHLSQFEGNWNGTLVGRMVVVAGEDTSNKDDGHLDFFTTSSGGSNERRLRIDSKGQLSSSGSTAAFDGTSSINGLQMYYETDNGIASFGSYSSGGNTELAFYTNAGGGAATEKLRIGSAGQIGLGGANYGSSGQVLTSQGSGSAVQWATPSTSTDPTTGTANNNVWQTVGSNISWHTNYNNTDNTIGSVSNCNQSNVYAIDVKVRIVFNNSGGTYNYNNTHGYIVGYVYQDGKNYFDKGVYTEAQHFDMYYNVFGTVYTIPWDPSGTQNLKIYCTYAYNTSTQNYFNIQVINKWTR